MLIFGVIHCLGFCWSKHGGLRAIPDSLLIVNALRYNQGKMTQQPSDTSGDNVKISSAKDHPQLTVHLRDISAGMVKAWKEAFKDDKYSKFIKASLSYCFILTIFTVIAYRLVKEIFLREAHQQMLL